MPWAIGDVDSHMSGLSDSKKKQWVKTANAILKQCIAQGGNDKTCAPKAIRIANSMAKKKKEFGGDEDIANTNVLRESFPLDLTEAKVDENAKTIKNVRFIAKGWSLNNRYYSKEALATLVPFLKEARVMFMNHRDISQGRDLRDRVSFIEKVWQTPVGDVYGDIRMSNNEDAGSLFEDIKADPSIIGVSIYAFARSYQGKVEEREGEIIKAFIGAHSVDWIYNPGAKGGFEDATIEKDFSHPLTSKEGMRVIENFEKDYYYQILRSMGYWFTDYIFYDIRYTRVNPQEKLQMVEEALDFFHAEFLKVVQDSGLLEEYGEYHEDESFVPSIERYGEALEEYKQDVINFIEKRKEEKEKAMNLQEIKEKYPETYALMLMEATIEAKKSFDTALEAIKVQTTDAQTAVKTATEELGTVKKENADLKTKVEGLEKEKMDLTAKVKEFTDVEATRKADADKTAREAHLTKILGEVKLEEKEIPALLLDQLRSLTLPEETVTALIKELAGLREAKRDKLENGGGKTEKTPTGRAALEATMFPEKK